MRKSQSVTQRVVWAVARETGRDPLELPSLYTAIDGDSLESYVETVNAGQLTFEYVGMTVTVHSGGSVEITSGTASADESVEDASIAAD